MYAKRRGSNVDDYTSLLIPSFEIFLFFAPEDFILYIYYLN